MTLNFRPVFFFFFPLGRRCLQDDHLNLSFFKSDSLRQSSPWLQNIAFLNEFDIEKSLPLNIECCDFIRSAFCFVSTVMDGIGMHVSAEKVILPE